MASALVVPRPAAMTGAFCAGPRQAHAQLLARKRNALLAQISAAPALPPLQQFEPEMVDSPPSHPPQQIDDDAAMMVATPVPIQRTALKRGRDHSPPADDDSDDMHTSPSHSSDDEEAFAPSRTRAHARVDKRRIQLDEEEHGEFDSSTASESESDFEEEEETAAAPAVPKAKRARTTTTTKPKAAATTATPTTSRKKAGARTNFVRHDSHRKNGCQAGPKSGKARRAEARRQKLGLGRWKSKAEYAREQREKAEQGMYCDVLTPSELKTLLAPGGAAARAAAGEDAAGGETDDELEALRQIEREQFGVTHGATKSTDAVDAEDEALDPMSPEAIERARKRAILAAQEAASLQAKAKSPTHLHQHTDASLLAILREQFRYDQFRPGQLATIKRVLGCDRVAAEEEKAMVSAVTDSSNVLAILPTGGGKSLIYQFLSLLLPGLTLIVSPLLSLMKDQLEHLPPFLRGAVWSSENTPKEVYELQEDLRAGRVKILFISPEKLLTQGFQSFIRDNVLTRSIAHTTAIALNATGASISLAPAPGLSLVVIDEVHCVAEWSHNFRSSYSRLEYVLYETFRVPRLLGLTATATRRTMQQVCAHLRIPAENIVRVPLARENLILSFECVRHEERFGALLQLLNAPPYRGLPSLIIYVAYKSVAESLCKYLKQHGHGSCDFYHAGLPLAQRHKVQTRFMTNKLSIVIATCAFGMGLDKKDVRGVIHLNLPRALENYIQEIGRGGRDGELTFCHTIWTKCDKEIAGSLLYSNGVDQYQLNRLLEKIFDTTHRSPHDQQPRPALAAAAAVDDDLAFHHRHYVALEVEPLRLSMELSEEVVSTLLTRLERLCGRTWIRFVAQLHNSVSISFFRRHPKTLAQTSGIVRACLEQNGWMPRTAASSHFTQAGVVWDHELRGGVPSATAAGGGGATASSMPEYTATEYAQLKQQNGCLLLDLAEGARRCGMDIADAQRELVRLKAAGEIGLKWDKMAFIVEVLEWPDEDGAATLQHSGDSTPVTIDTLRTALLAYLQQHETIAHEKLSIMAAALQIASLPHMHCSPADAILKAKRWRWSRIRFLERQKKLRAGMPSAQVDAEEAAEVDPHADAPAFFDLHKVMDAYFDADDPSEFLQQLQAQSAEAEGEAPDAPSTTSASAAQSLARTEREFESDVREFLRAHGDHLASGRELARICHGQKAPSHLAQSRSSRQRERRANGADPNELDDSTFGLSPYATHPLWGRYKALDFPRVLAQCELWLQQWKAGAGARLAQEAAVHEQRRVVKRQKVAEAQQRSAARLQARAAVAAPSVVPKASAAPRASAAPSSSSAPAPPTRNQPVVPLVAAAMSDDEVVIPCSDEE